MKIKNVLLISLAGFALASCGMKDFKTKVDRATYEKELNAAVNAFALFDSTKPFSYVSESTNESKMVETWLKDGKALTKQIKIEKTHTHQEYDCNNLIFRGGKIEKYDESNDYEHVIQEENSVSQIQAGNDAYYYVNVDENLYVKTLSLDPQQYMKNIFTEDIAMNKMLVLMFYISDNSVFYKDGTTFTVESTTNEENYYSHSIYQIVLNENNYEIYRKVETKETKENYLKEVEESGEIIFKRKDDLNLESVDLNKLLEVDKIPSIIYDDVDPIELLFNR